MRFRILGPLEVWSDKEGWSAIGAPKWRSLLACLLVRPGQLISTESLILELWGDSPPAKANNLVSIYVHRLRRLIGDSEGRLLVYRAPGYLLRIAPGDLDLEEFERLVAEGRSALAAAEPQRAAGLLAEALGLWRGRLLADVAPSTLISTEAERGNELRLDAAELRAEADLACGRAAQLVPELRRLVGENPIREGLWLLLISALDEAGRHAEALDTYTQARQVIADELGVDPGAELQELYAQLLAADASSARPRKRPIKADLPAVHAPGAVPGESAGSARPANAGTAAAAPGASADHLVEVEALIGAEDAQRTARGRLGDDRCRRGRRCRRGGRGTGQLATAAPDAAPCRYRGLHGPRGAGQAPVRDAGPGRGGEQPWRGADRRGGRGRGPRQDGAGRARRAPGQLGVS